MRARGLGGTKDRKLRVTQRQKGLWRSVNTDLLFVASKIYKQSEVEAKQSSDKNTSKMLFAGVPLLVASMHALIIECESIGVVSPPSVDPMDLLSNTLIEKYGLAGEILKDFQCLCEIRNEILHPVPLPTGTPDNWPDYLRHVKDKKLLCTHPTDPNTHYPFFDQMASHSLFAWAVWVTYHVYRHIIRSVPDRGCLLELFMSTFAGFSAENFSPVVWTAR